MCGRERNDIETLVVVVYVPRGDRRLPQSSALKDQMAFTQQTNKPSDPLMQKPRRNPRKANLNLARTRGQINATTNNRLRQHREVQAVHNRAPNVRHIKLDDCGS